MAVFDQNICFIDFETSGTNVFTDEPLQIGACLVDKDLKIIKTFNSYIKLKKGAKISREAQEIHKIESSSLEESPSSKEVVKMFFDYLGNDFCFAGWNISFDIPFFRKMCFEAKELKNFNEIDYRHIDVQTLFKIWAINSKSVQPGSFSHCLKTFGLKRATAHDAFEDATLTLEVFRILTQKFRNSDAT